MNQIWPEQIIGSDPGDERIVAVGLLTEHDLSVLGQGFRRAYRVEQEHGFHGLLAEIDRAERMMRGRRGD